MGSTCSSRSTDNTVDIISLETQPLLSSQHEQVITTTCSQYFTEDFIPPQGFFPEIPKTECQLHCQQIFTSLESSKNNVQKRKATQSLLSLFKKNGIMHKIHTYVDAISLSRPSFEILSNLLVESSAPYLVGLDKKHHSLLKGYAIFYWVSNNIEYNLTEWNQMLLSTKQAHLTVTPEHVFKRRSSVCSGYANLFRALGMAAGLEVEVINGYFRRSLSDDNSHKLFHIRSRNSHAWNAICIDKVWYLIDCTYGAGIVDESGFTKLYNDTYFAVPPEQLILTHWPDQSHWQLLEKTLELNDFKRLIVMTPDVCRLGLSFDACEIINITSDHLPLATVQVKLPSHNYTVIPTLTNLHKDPSINEYDRHLFIKKEEKLIARIYVILPNVGNYVLRIFIKDQTSIDSKTIFCTSYVICCNSESTRYYGFPKIFPQIACAVNFELLYWTGHVEKQEEKDDHLKSYISECTTGKMSLYFKADSSAKLTHMLTPGYFNSDQSSHLYNFYTALIPLERDTQVVLKDSIHYYRLDIVFPLEGLWTVCIMQKDLIDNTFNEPLLLYQVNVMKGIKNCTYPWIKSHQNVTIPFKGPFTVLGNEMFTLSFTVMSAKNTELCAVLKFISESHSNRDKEKEINYEQFINIDKQQQDGSYKLNVIFPVSGKWIVNVFHRPINSTQQLSGLFSLYFDVPFVIDNAIFPISTVPSFLNVCILDSLPLYYEQQNGIFKVRLSVFKSMYFNVKIYPTNVDGLTVNDSYCMQRDYWSYMESIEEKRGKDRVYCLHVMFHEVGQWNIILSGGQVSNEEQQDSDIEKSLTQLYIFKLHIKSIIDNDSHNMLYPKLYPAFHDLQVTIPSAVSYCYQIEDKLLYSFTSHLLYNYDFNVMIIFQDDLGHQERFNHQAIVYPNKCDTNKYHLEVVFPKKGHWIVQVFIRQINQQNYRPILGLYTIVKYPTINYTYPWINPSFFTTYQMSFKLPSFLLPSKLSQSENLSLTFTRPFNVGIIHQAKRENVGVIEGTTCLLQQTENCNEYILSTNFTTTGQWTLLLYATTTNATTTNATTTNVTATTTNAMMAHVSKSIISDDEWSLVFVHNLTVF